MTQDDINAAWPEGGEITGIAISSSQGELQCRVGHHGVTRIEKTVKAGECAFIPYVRVWVGDNAIAEHCQHRLNSVIFALKESA